MNDSIRPEGLGDPVLQEDLDELARGGFPFGRLSGSTVLVTGATGLIGSQIVKALACADRVRGAGIRIIAMYRNEKKADRVFGEIAGRPCFDSMVCDITDRLSYPGEIDYIIHCASATSSKYFVDHPAETIETALAGTRNILEFAREKNVRGVVYLSSLEVYGVPGQRMVSEQDYGYLDPLKVRSSYSEGKRMAECICASYAAEYGLPVKIARLSQSFGAGVEYNDGRVFAEFARCAIERKDIVLHTSGGTVRSYLYTRDAVSAILHILLDGESGQAYNASNTESAVSIRDMAQLVCDIFPEAGIKVRFDCPEDVSSFGYNPEMVIILDTEKLRALGWKAEVGLEEMFRRLVRSMRASSGQADSSKTGGIA